MLLAMEAPQRSWSAAKRYGWGWGLPRTWQGRLALLAYVVVVLAPPLLLPDRPAVGIAVVVLATAALTAICVRTGEPPRWRWGDR